MAGEYLKEVRKSYAEELLIKEQAERAAEIALADDLYTPILKVVEIHGEAEPKLSDINSMTKDVINDLDILHKEIAVSANKYSNLIEDAVNRVKEVNLKVRIEQERLMDLNMLCGENSGFQTVKTLTASDFEDKVAYKDGIFTARVLRTEDVNCEVLDVTGNGIEGNKHVYQDDDFLIKTVDTSTRENMVDGSIATSYEYARINGSRKEEVVFADMSFDDAEAECVVTIQAESPLSSIKIETGIATVILKEVLVSEDGLTYTTVSTKALAINESSENYGDSTYIYNSGIVTFPSSSFIKIVLQSRGYTRDKIAFEYVKNIS